MEKNMMSKKEKGRTLVGGVVVPVTTGVLIYWWTQDVFFAACIAFIPLGWEVIRLYVEYEAALKKGLFTLLARHEGRSSAHWRYQAATLPRVYSDANVESILTPKLQAVLFNGGTLVTVAGDGYSIHAEEYEWIDKLQGLLNDHCIVYQYAAAPTDKANAEFTALQSAWPDSFHYRKLASPCLVQNEEDRFLLDTLATLHPTYAIGSNGERMLWVERFHGAQATMASGCEFYSQEDLKINPSPFNAYQSMVDRAWAITQTTQAVA